MTHDFKKALEWFERRNRGMTIYEDHPYVAVVIALKLADRLMGEPSNEMRKLGVVAKYEGSCGINDIFKAMRDQLLKECEE